LLTKQIDGRKFSTRKCRSLVILGSMEATIEHKYKWVDHYESFKTPSKMQ